MRRNLYRPRVLFNEQNSFHSIIFFYYDFNKQNHNFKNKTNFYVS